MNINLRFESVCFAQPFNKINYKLQLALFAKSIIIVIVIITV